MSEEINISEATKEIKAASEDELRQVIETWFESTRAQGIKIGASYISAATYGMIQKHIIQKEKASLRDYKRCIDDILKIISVQLTKQNDSENDAENKQEEQV